MGWFSVVVRWVLPLLLASALSAFGAGAAFGMPTGSTSSPDSTETTASPSGAPSSSTSDSTDTTAQPTSSPEPSDDSPESSEGGVQTVELSEDQTWALFVGLGLLVFLSALRTMAAFGRGGRRD